MRTAGVCNTDLELAKGYMGFSGVLGHEFVAEALDGEKAGSRVVAGINFACGRCAACLADAGRHCPERTVLGIDGADGAFAEELVVPACNLVEVPAAVSDEAAVFTEPLAAACEILDQIGDLARQDALVLGAGKLGPLIAQVLASAGFVVDLVGRHTDSLAWIEDHGVRLSGESPDRGGYALVVEATGTADGLASAIACTRPRGTLVLKTTVAGSHQVDLAPVVINEITLIGSRCGRFEPALELLATGRVAVTPMIDARYDLEDAERAFAHAARRGVRKVLIRNSI